MYLVACSKFIESNSSWFGLLKLTQTLSTAVSITNISASRSFANLALDLSLSITAATPCNDPSSFSITGIPPPPTVITIVPLSTKFLTVSSSTIFFGWGEATTLLYPLPASSTKVNPFSDDIFSASSFV